MYALRRSSDRILANYWLVSQMLKVVRAELFD